MAATYLTDSTNGTIVGAISGSSIGYLTPGGTMQTLTASDQSNPVSYPSLASDPVLIEYYDGGAAGLSRLYANGRLIASIRRNAQTVGPPAAIFTLLVSSLFNVTHILQARNLTGGSNTTYIANGTHYGISTFRGAADSGIGMDFRHLIMMEF